MAQPPQRTLRPGHTSAALHNTRKTRSPFGPREQAFSPSERRLFAGAVSAAFLILTATVTAACGDDGQTPRCALLDLSKSPVAALVEAKLLAQPDATWLERTEIDKVLAEQELSALLVATALKRRVAIGRVLKAEILVLLETKEENKQQRVRLVVAETSGGLRLVSTKIPLTGEADSDAERIAELVLKAIDKQGEENTEVFTVPPFYSRDLTYEFDDLKRTYATLVQQRLLAHPGVLVVELEEADAIAREYALASPGDRPTRRLPLYLLGEYRNEGVGDQRRIALTMRLKRGDATLHTTQTTVSPDAAADILLQVADELAGRKEDRKIGSNTPLEARQLAQRGAEFLKLGDWDEALALSQASLLLRPNQTDVHDQVRRAAAELAISHQRPKDVETALRGIAYRRLALRHLDAVARSNPELDRFFWSVWQTLPMHGVSYKIWESGRVPDEITKACALLEAEERAFLVKLAHRYARTKSWNLGGRILDMAQTSMAPTDRYTQRRQFILEYQDEASPATLLRYIGHARYSDFPNSLEARQFLEDLASASEAKPDLRAAARATARRLDQKRVALSKGAAKLVPERPARTEASQRGGLRLRPLPVTWRDTEGGERKVTRIHGCLPIPGCADVLWNHQAGIYLMRRKGEAELVWPEERIQNTDIRSVVYDGKYVWFTTRIHRQIPQVWVLEPSSGRKWQLTTDHGLPLFLPDPSSANALVTPSALATPIAPGKAMLAGSFGRAWLAKIEFHPDGDHQVQVFHEARKVENRYDFHSWKDPEVAFGAGYALTLTSGDRNTNQFEQRIMVGRGAAGLSSHPLIVNPETLSVDVRKEYWYKRPGSDVWRGALYFTLGIPPRCETIALWRCTASDLTPTPLIRGVQEGIVIMQDDAVNIVGKQWWRGELADGKLECLGDVPWRYSNRLAASAPMESRPGQPTDLRLEAIGRSHHYGVLTSFDRSEDSVQPTLSQVSFDASEGDG